MSSAEHVPIKPLGEQYLQTGADAIDLTIIYNSHNDGVDAQQSVAYIEPDSLVFLEGFSYLSGGEPHHMSDLAYLNYLRLTSGKDSPEYLKGKDEVLGCIESELYSPARSSTDFSRNGLTQIKLLLQRDCIISYADYYHLQGVGDDQAKFDENHALFVELSENRSALIPQIPQDMAVDQSIGSVMKSMQVETANEFMLHFMRESQAVRETLRIAAGIVARVDTSGAAVNLNDEGKIKAYLTYGAAHSRSLTSKFEEYHIKPKVVELLDLPEWRYIDATLDTYTENRRRRIGVAALEDIALDYHEFDRVDEILNEGYETLGFLNGSKDEVRKFLMQCIQIRKTQDTDPEDAYRQYLSLLRGFMPKPELFV